MGEICVVLFLFCCTKLINRELEKNRTFSEGSAIITIPQDENYSIVTKPSKLRHRRGKN